MAHQSQVHVFVATLEGSLLAYTFDPAAGDLKPLFTAKDHIGRIRSVHATPEGRLVTAGEDELLKTYNVRTRKAVGTIASVTGTPVRVLSTGRFLVSGHENGQVFILGKKDGQVFHVLRAFKTGLKGMALHPSGKLLLCLSPTNRFSMWDLMSCSMVFHKKIRVAIQGMDFYSDQDLLFWTDTSLYLYSMAVMRFVVEVPAEEDTKFTDVTVVRREGGAWVVLACENGFVYFLNPRNFVEGTEGVSWAKFKAYERRVKRVRLVESLLVTVSTDGDITFWDVADILERSDLVGQVTIDGFCSLLDYKVNSRPILLETVISTASTPAEQPDDEEEVQTETAAEAPPEAPVQAKRKAPVPSATPQKRIHKKHRKGG